MYRKMHTPLSTIYLLHGSAVGVNLGNVPKAKNKERRKEGIASSGLHTPFHVEIKATLSLYMNGKNTRGSVVTVLGSQSRLRSFLSNSAAGSIYLPKRNELLGFC